LPLIPQEVTKAFTRLVRENNLPHLCLHGLRHANATLQLAAGINPKVVSEGLGHSNISITLDLYSHVLPNMQQHAVDAVADLLKRG
jgi:integrase